ncbi:hypothetical protein O3M35_008427 [Rhynocoris fuscipes]|uniref:Uncharacterized protein n=1 Tax=Rhynocoris fuscipes TaxID=488301 RepID=A0AAW1DD73_9HEMI
MEGSGTILDKEEFDTESEELDNSDNDIDYFKDVPGDVSDIKYKDFYKDQEDHQLKNTDMLEIDEEMRSEESDSSERHEVKESKSAFELKEEKKKRKITKLEEDLLKSKPWTLQGEVDASQRPFNSLLEEVVEVDLSQRPPPVITRKRTKKLHNIICEIILNKSFDDVEKKQKPVSNVNEFKNKIVLDQEKSKLSLAEIYEKKYLKEMENKSTEEKEETESAEKKEIRELMHSVITKLQALSNLYFTPKPAIPELRVVSNLPAVAIEEVGPIAISHDKLLAPEEISGISKRLDMDKEERTATDKKRERRKKKLLQKYRAKRAGKNENLSTSGKKYKNTEQLTESSDIKQLKTSKTFFDQLQQKQELNIKLPKGSKVPNNFKGNSLTAKKNKKRKPDSVSGRIEPKKIKL